MELEFTSQAVSSMVRRVLRDDRGVVSPYALLIAAAAVIGVALAIAMLQSVASPLKVLVLMGLAAGGLAVLAAVVSVSMIVGVQQDPYSRWR